MPYKVGQGRGCSGSKPWSVYNAETGKKHGCHPSRGAAIGQQRALYAASGTEDKDIDAIIEADEVEEKNGYEPDDWKPFYGAISFEELVQLEEASMKTNAIKEINYQFSALSQNIMGDDEIEDKGAALSALVAEYQQRIANGPSMLSANKGVLETIKDAIMGEVEEKSPIKRENGMDFPARDYAFAPDPSKPSTWRLRLTETPGKLSRGQLQRVSLALRSEKTAGVPAAAMNAVRRAVRAAFRKIGIPDAQLPPSIREGARIVRTMKEADESWVIWKDVSTGVYHWMAVYSNKFRDDDHPPEIISEKSHKAFTYLANEGIMPMPRLWHWHTPGTEWGIATHLDYVDGFAIAIGTVHPGHEKEAEALAERDDIGVSHGMYVRNILRDANDSSVINFHVTHEISDLPHQRAANKLTGFVVIEQKEKDMPFAKDKRDHLLAVGLTDEEINSIENKLTATGKAADEAGVESKEAEPLTLEILQPVQATELAEVLADLVGPISKALNDLSARMGAMEATVKELAVTDAAKVAKAAADTPRASLRELVAQSIIGNKDAQVDGRTTEAQGPKQTAPTVNRLTPSGFLDGIMSVSNQG